MFRAEVPAAKFNCSSPGPVKVLAMVVMALRVVVVSSNSQMELVPTETWPMPSASCAVLTCATTVPALLLMMVPPV